MNYTADAPPCKNMIKRSVNGLKRHGIGDQLIQLNFAAHVLVYHSGQSRSAFETAECGAAPNPPGNQLERAGADFLPSTGDANDDRFTPAFVATLERLWYQINVTHALKGLVDAAFVMSIKTSEIGTL